MSPPPPKLLTDADAGTPPAALAKRYELSLSRVYAILREHRPDRARSPRSRSSALPDRIREMRARLPDTTQSRIAELLGISRAYVSRVLSEG